MDYLNEIVGGLRFPEGPIAMPDGSVILVEIARQTLTRVESSGHTEVIAHLGGGPNGAAIGPDGACYICNNGGSRWVDKPGVLFPTLPADDYDGGYIQRVDLDTGEVRTLYTACGDYKLTAPNDLVFDAQGGMWFSDHGKTRRRTHDRGGVYYAKADGSSIREAIFPIDAPNGVGLSQDEKKLYVAETHTARLWAFDIIEPGVIHPDRTVPVERGTCLYGAGGYRMFDSLALDGDGNVCIATLIEGGMSVVAPDGSLKDFVPLPDRFPTNICFGGEDLRTAFITLSGTGRLVSMPWPRPGLPLNFLNAGAAKVHQLMQV